MSKAALYNRRSQDAEDRQVLSIESQIKENTTLAKKHGFSAKSYEVFSESQTAHKPGRPEFARMMEKIYSGEIDFYNNIEACRRSRLKKRTSAGGCQCMHIDGFNRLTGFNEAMVGWGSEDVELLKRARLMGQKVIWMGETPDTVNLFHQHHKKDNLKFDLQCQNKNKKIFNSVKDFKVNLNGWGGQDN